MAKQFTIEILKEKPMRCLKLENPAPSLCQTAEALPGEVLISANDFIEICGIDEDDFDEVAESEFNGMPIFLVNNLCGFRQSYLIDFLKALSDDYSSVGAGRMLNALLEAGLNAVMQPKLDH